MNQEQILVIINDLVQTMGGETRSARLIRKVLQRLLFHTGFSAGLWVLHPHPVSPELGSCLEVAIGDRQLMGQQGQALMLPPSLLQGEAALIHEPNLLALLPETSRTYQSCLKLPVDQEACILLLATQANFQDAVMLQVLQPVLAHLSRTLSVCRQREQQTQALMEDRNEARSALAQTLTQERKERSFLNNLKNAIPDLVWLKNPKGEYLACNPAFEAMVGFSEAELIGLTDYDVVPRELAEFFRNKDQEALLRNETLVNEEWLISASTGQKSLLETRKTPMRDEDGQLIGILGIARDITGHKQLEDELAAHRDHLQNLVEERTRELAQAKALAEAANQAKSRFLAAASHDLHQPLAALGLYVDAMAQGCGVGGDAEMFHAMRNCVDHLQHLLTDLLDYSRTEVGVIKVRETPFALDTLLASLVAVHASEAAQKGIALRWVPTGLQLNTDPVLLRRILGNLLANAIRYTHKGGVLMGCRRRGGRNWVGVWDTGVGIPPERQADVFEEFQQLENSGSNGGCGLGLAIAARTAAVLGQEICLRSRPGRGSMFAVSLPEPMPAKAPPEPSSSLKIFLLEDHPQLRNALSCVMASEGHQVVAAATGQELWRNGSGKPDILVSDYHLDDEGGEDGLEVMAEAHRRWGVDFPVIIMSGDPDPALEGRVREAGGSLLRKPLDRGALLAAIHRLAGPG